MVKRLDEGMLRRPAQITRSCQAASLLRAMANCPKPHRDRRPLKKPFQMDGLKQVLQSALDSIERTELGCSLPPANADSSVVVADRRFHRAC